MKIVAKISSKVVLVEMTNEELADICGLPYDHPIRHPSWDDKLLNPGNTFKPSQAWHRLCSQQRAGDQLKQAAQSLRALADLVETQLPAVELVTQMATEETGGSK